MGFVKGLTGKALFLALWLTVAPTLAAGEREVSVSLIFSPFSSSNPVPTVTLMWGGGSDPALGFELQQTDSLEPPARWIPVGESPVVEGPMQHATVPITAGSTFFRLASPLNHVLIVGQSLAMGAYASDILSADQPYHNKMFVGQRLDGGQPGLLPDDLSALVPLHEQWDPAQFGGETMASGFANWLSAQPGMSGYDTLVSNAARGASGYALLQRIPSGSPSEEPTGTYPYLRGLAQVRAGRSLASDSGYRFRAVLAVHGEGDHINQRYDTDIRQWQEDYQGDIWSITGQTNLIPMFHTQISAWGNLGNAIRTLSPFKVLEEYERNPDKTVLVGPKYFLPYSTDGLHLTSIGYRWLGEYYAKAYFQQVVLHKPWSPLRPEPEGVQRQGNIIELSFTGIVGQLVLDTNLVTDPAGTVVLDPNGSPTHGAVNHHIGPYGFEYRDDAGSGDPWSCSTWISSVELMGTNQVRVTLNQLPQGNDRRIRYAWTALNESAGGLGGPEKGPRGCLRDQDPSLSRFGHPLYNWCVHFDKPCP